MVLYKIEKLDGRSLACGLDCDRSGDGVVWEQLTLAHVDRLLDAGPFDLNEGRERLIRGDRCYTASLNGRLVHYCWVQRSGYHHILKAGVSLPVRGGEFWIYNCRTAESARGRGLYPANLRHILHDHFQQEFTAAWVYTAKENVSSRSGIVKAGFTPVATLTAIRIGSRYFPVGDGKRHFFS